MNIFVYIWRLIFLILDMNYMKLKYILSAWMGACLLLVASCGVNQQAKQIKALEKCHYDIRGVDSLFVAGTDVLSLLRKGSIDLSNMSGVAFGMLSKEIPLQGVVRVNIKNPTKDLAGINQFKYLLLVDGHEVAEGLMDQKIALDAGEEKIFPVRVNANIYGLLSNRNLLNQVIDFISTSDVNNEAVLTIKLKPTLAIGNKSINYPGWISFDRKINRQVLLSRLY